LGINCYQGFFSQVGEAALPLILGEKIHGIFAKGEEKNLCKFKFWGKLHDFKEFFWGEAGL
jgi:hypothetical protein